ncbi:hypothetical protein [Bradyrhizobium sp. USDA 4454]
MYPPGDVNIRAQENFAVTLACVQHPTRIRATLAQWLTPAARLPPPVEKISPEKAAHLTARFGA